METTKRFATLATFIVLSIAAVDATVDPDNATTLVIEDGTRFNVTHLYWRDRVRSRSGNVVGVWVNPYELPESLQYYFRKQWYTINSTDDIYSLVLRTALRVLYDWEVPHKRLFFSDYYRKLAQDSTFIGGSPLIPLARGFVPRNYDRYGYPLQIHFRYKPYPQSSFGEFVSNRAVSWRVWARDDDYRSSSRVGDDDDLLYRMRHNIGHSLGLGHTTSRECIMYPTNIRGLVAFCPKELTAMRRLLSNQPLIARTYRRRTY